MIARPAGDRAVIGWPWVIAGFVVLVGLIVGVGLLVRRFVRRRRAACAGGVSAAGSRATYAQARPPLHRDLDASSFT